MINIQHIVYKIQSDIPLNREEKKILLQYLTTSFSTKELNAREGLPVRESMRLSGGTCPACGK